jgi:thymidylate synthase (FAD)
VKLISPTFDIVNPESQNAGVAMLRRIETFARISHRSEDRQTADSWERFIQAVVLQHGDWSVTEHCSATVIFRLDRGVTHELVRHRIGAYTQESTRFVNYGNKEIEFIVPEFADNEIAFKSWQNSVSEAEVSYKLLLKYGAAPQIARSVLPNATASTIAVTYNLRNWRHVFMMRTTKETHPDLRRVMIPLLQEFQQRIPLLYDDIEPELKQSISQSRPR